MAGWRLVADVGGTHVRFARAVEGGRLVDRTEGDTVRHADFAEALGAYLETVGAAGPCAEASIAAAGPVAGGAVRLTNGTWTIRRDAVSRRLGGVPVHLFNDLQAAALGIPWLEAADLLAVVAPEAPAAEGARLAVNVGTGFGAATLVPAPGGWASLAAEPGHMTFGATTEGELALRRDARPPVRSVEDALSGGGLVGLCRFYAGPGAAAPATSREILARAADDAAAGRAVEAFTALLGRVAGDLVLAAGAWAGVYLFGGVVEGWHATADTRLFAAHFTDKGKMSARMAAVPVHVVTNEAAPLIGLARH